MNKVVWILTIKRRQPENEMPEVQNFERERERERERVDEIAFPDKNFPV